MSTSPESGRHGDPPTARCLPTTGGDRGSGKDHAEHLRSVHFGLLALSFGLLVVWSARTRLDVVNADLQLSGILDAVAKMNELPSWLDDQIEKAVEDRRTEFLKAFPPPGTPGYVRLVEDSSPHPPGLPRRAADMSIRLKRPKGVDTVLSLQFGPRYTLRAWKAPAILEAPFGGSIPRPGSRVGQDSVPSHLPRTLGEFEHLWSALETDLQAYYAVDLATRFRFEARQRGDEEVGSWELVDSAAEVEMTCSLSLTQYSEIQTNAMRPELGRFYMGYAYAGLCDAPVGRSAPHVSVPVRTEAATVEGLKALRGLFKEAPRPGPFSSVFRELVEITGAYKDVEFEPMRRILESEKNRSADAYELFGARVPVERVSGWGMLALLAVQLYFLSHLREFRRRLDAEDEGWQVAWVGLYRDRLSQGLTLLSAFALPTFVVLLLGARGASTFGDWSRTAIAVSVSGWASVQGYRAWRGLRGAPLAPVPELDAE